MKLTPLDIRKHEFKKSLRGFDPEEVEAFLIMVADELELLVRERNQLNDELVKLRTQLKDYQQVEQTLRDTLVKASNTVEESRANSLREAELRIQQAEVRADKIVEKARGDLKEIQNEITLLKAQKESFAKRLRHLLESQIELLEVMNLDEAELKLPPESKGESHATRGRLPRPVIPDDSSIENKTSQEEESTETDDFPITPGEPKIIRGETKFDEAYYKRRRNRPDEGKDDNRSEGRLSDQIVM